MKAITGVANTAFFGFFSSHIVATLIIDVQAVMPARWIPQGMQDLLSWYATTFKDPLMSNAKNLLWFQSLVGLEMVVQLPFFFLACYMLLQKELTVYPERFRYACIIYGAHASTSMVPILCALTANPEATFTERAILLSIYLPYLLFPMALIYYATSSSSLKNKKS